MKESIGICSYSWNLNTTEESYNLRTFSKNKILLAIAAAIGTTNHTIAAKATFNPASIEANGPTNPTIPNPCRLWSTAY